MNIIYGIVCALFCFICLSCSDETENAFVPTETELILQINTGQNTFTRVDGTTTSSAESAWDNVIHYLDVFIFDSKTGDLVSDCYFHFGDGSNNIASPVCLISGNWKTRFQGHETCDVYVVANSHIFSSGNDIEAGKKEFSSISNLNALQQLIDEYQKIYQPVSLDGKKPFTMSGCRIDWKPAESSNIYTIPVELTRLAAKIEISLNLQFTEITTEVNGISYEYPTNTNIGRLQYSVHNYATNALVLPGNDDTFEYSIESAAEANLKFVDKDDSGKSVPKIIAYTYPTEWTNDILKETYVIFNAQLISAKPISGAYQYMDNYYKIPLRLSTDENKKLERNHWYKVRAEISALGNATPDKPVELTNVQYDVAPWNDMNINIKGDAPMYLELSEYDVVMRNVDTYDLTFASSSQIKSATISNIYYINKNGKSVSVTNNQIKATTTVGLNGTLSIYSPVPENKTIRYMTLTVVNDQDLSKTVTIKQYPLEYITGIAGLYSYLENDNRYTNAWPTNLTTIGNIEIDQRIRDGLDKHIGKSVDMKSKFYLENGDNSKIYRIDYSYNQNDNYLRDNGTASNNQMYHVVITSTSGDYQLGRPIMTDDDVVDPNQSDNDDLVSPSFMLASQLGNSSTIEWEDAQNQCKNYVEVGNNNKVYDDWRLPTAAEIGILIKYQSDENVNTGDDNGVMDNILNSQDKNETDPYYWVSSEKKYVLVKNSYNKDEQLKSDRTECRVRCVRDFHVGEPTE